MLTARLERADFTGPFAAWRRYAQQRIEAAALIATDRGAAKLKSDIREAMRNAGLGNLGQALDYSSDLKRGGVQRRFSNGGFQVSGFVYVRSGSERTRGAITSYTSGATITPKRGRWLWIPTDEIPRVTGRYRMTPELWVKNGFEAKIGPLVFVKSVNGYPLLVVKGASVAMSGKRRSAKSLTKAGLPRKGQVAKEFIVAFVGIPRTSRQARINVRALQAEVMSQLPALMRQALGRI